MEDGWMDGRMDGLMDGRMDGWMAGWTETVIIELTKFQLSWS